MNAPQALGKYRIAGIVGESATAVVYRAFDAELQRPVALKSLRAFVSGDRRASRAFADRLTDEANAVARLAHPGIVAIHEVDEADGRPYIAMEYVAGLDLAQWLAATPLPPLSLVLQVMDQLLDALEAAHRAGVRHGDLKPSNVIVTGTGVVKITDFGLARAEGRTGGRAGIAPEYQSGRLIDHRVDVYAAGVLFYRMLVGRDPFAEDSSSHDSLGATARPPSMVAEAGRPATYDLVVARAMAHEPGQRYASAGDFREALRDAAGQHAPLVGARDVSLGAPDQAEAAAAPAGDAAAGPPVLTIAIPDSVLAMPAFDPWAVKGGSGDRVTAVAAGSPRPDDPGHDRLILNDDAFVAFIDQVDRERRSNVASAAAEATAALSAAAVAAEARARAAIAGRLPLPAAAARPSGPVVTSPVSAAAPVRDAWPTSAPRAPSGALADGDLQLAHPVENPAIPAEALRRVLRVLSAHFGADAGDVLKLVAGRARTIDDLHAMLVDQCGPGIDKKRMAKQLKAVARLPL